MEARERKRILGEYGVGYEDPRRARERRSLERELAGAGGARRQARPRANPFGPSLEGYVAAQGGPLPYMVRLREIAAQTQAHERALEEAWLRLATECRPDSRRFARRWRRLLSRWDFTAVNDLIERHNRFYPVESRLPMDPRTGDFALVNGEPYRKSALGVEWALERFPPALAAVPATRA